MWSMSIAKKLESIPNALQDAAVRYVNRHGDEQDKADERHPVHVAESIAYRDPEQPRLRSAWERTKGRLLGLSPSRTRLYFPPNDPRWMVYVGSYEKC